MINRRSSSIREVKVCPPESSMSSFRKQLLPKMLNYSYNLLLQLPKWWILLPVWISMCPTKQNISALITTLLLNRLRNELSLAYPVFEQSRRHWSLPQRCNHCSASHSGCQCKAWNPNVMHSIWVNCSWLSVVQAVTGKQQVSLAWLTQTAGFH